MSARRGSVAVVAAAVVLETGVLLLWPRTDDVALAPAELARAADVAATQLGAHAGARTAIQPDALSGEVANTNVEVGGLRGLAVISGVVFAAEDGRPLAGAEVTLQGWPSSDAVVAAYRRPLRWQDPAPLTTGDDGRFAFSPKPLPPLGWDLFVRAPGRAAAHRRWWKLAADRAEKPCEIKLLREFAVRAAAVTAEGAPAAGATVQLSVQLAPDKAGQSTRYVRAVSDAGGNLDFPPLPVGSHQVSNWLEGAWRVVGRPVVQLGADGSASGTRIVVAALEATITGRVLDDAGAVLPGVELRATTGEWETGGDLGKAITDAAGRFVLGRHRDPDPGAPVQLVLGDGSVLSPAPTWNAPARDFVAKRAGHVRLRVLDAQDNPVQRYAVEWVGGHKPARVGSIGGHHVGGEADLGACAAGTCYLDVLPGGDDLGRAGLVTIEVAPASTHTAVVKLTPPVRRTVSVATSAGESVIGAGVVFVVVPPGMPAAEIEKKVTMARQPGGGAQQAWILVQTKTNHEAQATVTLPVGLTRYALVVHAEHFVRAQSIYDLDVTKPNDVIDVVLSAGATLRGRVLPADFAQHAARLLRVDAGQLVVEARSLLRPHDNRQGALRGDAFELRGLAPGTNELALGRSFWANVPLARHVEVHGDGTRDEVLDLRHLVPATLKGRVVAGGQPAAHAKVCVFGPRWSLQGDVTTDAAGHFTCEAVLPGLLWVRAEKVGMDPDPIEATPGGVHERTFHVAGTSVTLRLQRGGVPVRDGMFTLLLQPHEVFVASSHVQDERTVFAGVPPGSYVVRRALPGRTQWCGEFSVTADASSIELEVTLEASAAASPR